MGVANMCSCQGLEALQSGTNEDSHQRLDTGPGVVFDTGLFDCTRVHLQVFCSKLAAFSRASVRPLLMVLVCFFYFLFLRWLSRGASARCRVQTVKLIVNI